MSAAHNETLMPTVADGPGFLGGMLWATAVLLVCTLVVGAAFQCSPDPSGQRDVMAAH